MKYSFKGTYQIKATDDFGQELDASDICLDPEIKNDFEADRRLNVSELVSIAKEISAQMSDGFGEDTSNETWIAGHTEAFNPSYSGEECDDEEYVHSEINCRVEFGLDWKLI